MSVNSEMSARMAPPKTKAHTSVVRVADDWYIVCESMRFSQKPLPETLMETPIVLFRYKNGAICALLDRRPH